MKESSSIYEKIVEKEGFNYAIIIIIPYINNNDGKLYIVSQIIRNENQEEIIIPAENNAIIIYQNEDDDDYDYDYDYDDEEDYLYRKILLKTKKIWKEKNYLKEGEYWEEEETLPEEEDWNEGEDDYKGEADISYNVLTIFYSEAKNMRLLNNGKDFENSDFIAQNSYPFPIYVDKSKKNIKIKIKIYKPKYAFFAAFNNNLLDFYIPLLSSLEENSYLYDSDQFFPLYLRINTDSSEVYEFINFYLYNSEANTNFYIKKIYGDTDIYEYDKSIDKNDLSIITKPISYS